MARVFRVVLASASPARLQVLQRAGIEPEVIVSGIDEEKVTARRPVVLAALLAEQKAQAVSQQLAGHEPALVIGCDSILEFEGQSFGKPASADEAIARWQLMRGRHGVLHTGHHVILRDRGVHQITATGSTMVRFADLSDAEIRAYVATNEPLVVAGAFTIDGLGGPFISGIEGDPHNVIGLSLPLLRDMLTELGISWPELWSTHN
ncbi:MAG TPA: septum formation inhibitor Maf [Propionibacterium sp.]|jgi:septum formation protein|nr:septum formation inhibitor Maf [Propionibacterium sp.]